MRKILVGIDGSRGSEHALNKALMVIDEFGEIILLAVIPDQNEEYFIDENIRKILHKKAKQLIDDIIADIGQHDFSIRGFIEEGDPAEKIIDMADSLKVDLIVLGSRGASKLGKYPIGSIANKVVQYAYKPVMVVR
jgi:nucleotide-binding universal stress UspA family protein